MPILQNIKSCVRRKHGVTRCPTKVHFNVGITSAFKSENVASQLRNLLVYIAREGVAVTDLFRRPGNPRSIKKIIADLEAGQVIDWTEYNFYTLANIAKRFLLSIDGGILGEASEEALLKALDIDDVDARYSAMHTIIASQPKIVQQLLTLLFGTWFRMIYHTEVNAMSVEAVAKSVAGSIFPSCTYSPEKVEKASKVMEVLIVGFASTQLFGSELIEYFTTETKTSISKTDKFKYEFRCPKSVPRPRVTRMLMQMLSEESKKHGFDLIRDEVTLEEFEATHQPLVSSCCPQPTLPTDNGSGFRFGSDANKRVSSAHVASSDETDPTSFDNVKNDRNHSPIHNNGPIRTSSLRTPLTTLQRAPTPASMYFTNPERMLNFNGETSDSGLARVDRVEQFSEKRTCILATPDSGFRQTSTDDNHNNNHARLEDSFSDLSDPLDSQSLTADLACPQGGCFNLVKRRQLERLQKRSDWFLSPPAGLRNSGLMRFEANSPEMPRTASKISRSSLKVNGADGGHRCRLCSSSQGDANSTLKADGEEGGELKDTRDCGQLRRKVSNRQAFVHETAAAVEDGGQNYLPSTSRQFSLSAGHSTHRDMASQSPRVNGSSLPSVPIVLDNDDYSVETRYFISVKYYGFDPRSQMENSFIPGAPLSREL